LVWDINQQISKLAVLIMHSQEQISQMLQKVLDANGHSFQYAVMRRAHELRESDKTMWLLEGAELPVTVNNKVIHVDFVFRHKKAPIYLIAECKRSDPSKANWCFVKAPYTFRDDRKTFAYFDLLKLPRAGTSHANYGCKIADTTQGIYHLGYEIKTGADGDGTGNSRNSAINDAVTQAFRGSSGFINSLFYQNKIANLSINENYLFIPVVFTTAKIWSSESNLSDASLENGYLPKQSVEIQQNKWIWFNHNRSRELLHNVSYTPIADLYLKPNKEYMRSVAIVGTDGIDNFFETNMNDWLED
jgi:hypothetical protein